MCSVLCYSTRCSLQVLMDCYILHEQLVMLSTAQSEPLRRLSSCTYTPWQTMGSEPDSSTGEVPIVPDTLKGLKKY